ncbi:CIR protein [Plasmodium chabaudi adami]|uniref:CIR protein n=1 Tax=Plasmodium chabaudi adami TaxID=5826 RepID=A0A1C6WLY4_PLACE|nr:CIR protein [Plasmodium chabaudi adami]
MAITACDAFREVDELFDDKSLDEEQFNSKSGLYNQYCPAKHGTRKCNNDYEKLNAILGYAYTELKKNDLMNLDSEYYPDTDFLVMGWCHRLYKISKDHNLSLNDAFKKYLGKSVGSFNYRSILYNKKYLMDSNIAIMNMLYLLFQQICETINIYESHHVHPHKYISGVTQCHIMYNELHKYVNQCGPYLQLLKHLKTLYDEFINAAIKINSDNPSIRSQLIKLSSIDKTKLGSEFNSAGCKKLHKKLTKKTPMIIKIGIQMLKDDEKSKLQESNQTTEDEYEDEDDYDDDDEDDDEGDSVDIFDGSEKEDDTIETIDNTAPNYENDTGNTSDQSNESKDDSNQSQCDTKNNTDDSNGKALCLGNGIVTSLENQKSGESFTETPKAPEPEPEPLPTHQPLVSQTQETEQKDEPSSLNSDSFKEPQITSYSSHDWQTNNDGDTECQEMDFEDKSNELEKQEDNSESVKCSQTRLIESTQLKKNGPDAPTLQDNPPKAVDPEESPPFPNPSSSQESSHPTQELPSPQNVSSNNESLQKDSEYDQVNPQSEQTNHENTAPPSKHLVENLPNDASELLQKNQIPTNEITSPPGNKEPESQDTKNNLPVQKDKPEGNQKETQENQTMQYLLPLSSESSSPKSLNQDLQTSHQNVYSMESKGPVSVNYNSSSKNSEDESGNHANEIKGNIQKKIFSWAIYNRYKVISIGVIVFLIPIILAFMYKYLSPGRTKKSKRKKNMKKVINLVDVNKTAKKVINSIERGKKSKIIVNSDDNKKIAKIIIKSADTKKMTSPIINPVHGGKKSLLNIYKLMQADPVPFINLFFLLIFFVYKRKLDTILW